MIRTMALLADDTLTTSLTIDEILQHQHLKWYWVDFSAPILSETTELEKLGFHPLAIEDCLRFLQKPKLDYYDNYHFFVLQALNPVLLKPEEIDVFIAEHRIVTFHYQERQEIDELWERMLTKAEHKHPNYIHYKLIDKIVDFYFPNVQKIEDRLARVEHYLSQSYGRTQTHLQEIYQIRSDLLALRFVILPMQDLLYRMLNSKRLNYNQEDLRYYSDIHDHLCKLSAMIDSSRAYTREIQDHYLSLNAHRMNQIMMTLTVITTIFMPLTFIAGIYGMNFKHMPELESDYGYYIVLGIMLILSLLLFLFFKRKGWFDTDKNSKP